MLCDRAAFLTIPIGTCKDAIRYYCHLPCSRNRETVRPEMNSVWSPGVNREDMFFLVLQFFSAEFLDTQHHHTVIAATIPCQGRIFANAGVAWSQHVGLSKPYLSVKSPIARFMGPTWDPSGTDRVEVGLMFAPCTLLSGMPLFQWPASILNFMWQVSSGDQLTSVTSWICWHGGYWGMVHYIESVFGNQS